MRLLRFAAAHLGFLCACFAIGETVFLLCANPASNEIGPGREFPTLQAAEAALSVAIAREWRAPTASASGAQPLLQADNRRQATQDSVNRSGCVATTSGLGGTGKESGRLGTRVAGMLEAARDFAAFGLATRTARMPKGDCPRFG